MDARHAAAFALLVSGASCGGPRTVVENRGPALASDVTTSGVSSFVWLSGGAEIAYISAGAQLVAVRVADGVRRQLDPATPYFAAGVARSPDESALYFITYDPSAAVPRFTLREALAHRDVPVGEVTPISPSISPDARRVLYWTGGAGSVIDASGVTFSVPSCTAWPVLPVFSPSGEQLLCAGESAVLFTLADASSRRLPDTDSSSWRALYWNGTGLQAVALVPGRGSENVHLTDAESGQRRPIYEQSQGLLDFGLGNAAISEDGRFVAFWETECLQPDSIFSCHAGQNEARLKVVEVASGRAQTVASGAGGPGPVVFSDDGARIAYVFQAGYGELHVRAAH
jgi:hypothetical protein